MSNALLVMNPIAGQGKLFVQRGSLLDSMRIIFDQVELVITQEEGDIAKIVAHKAALVDALLVAGGDGTVHEMINAICPLPIRPILGIIPGGTCNDFSRTLGISQDPIEAVKQISLKHIKQIDMGYSEDVSGKSQYFSNFWGIGMMTNVSANIDPDEKERLGRLAYYLSTVRQLDDPNPFNVQLTSEDMQYEGQAAMVLIGNGQFTGGVRAFFPLSNIQDGKLDVLVVKQPSVQLAWEWLYSKVTQEVPENEVVLYFQTEHIQVKSNPAQLIDCDGERDNYTPTTLRVLKGHLSMFVGDLQSNEL